MWYVGGGEKKEKKKEGNRSKGRERGKKLRKEGILGVVKKINILKNEIVKLKQGVQCSGALAKLEKVGFLESIWQKI